MSQEIHLEVSGYPPAKGEAISMLGAGHSHAPRVRRLLEEAEKALVTGQAIPLGDRPIGLEMVLRCPRGHGRGDATNYLGGVADVLEDKSHRTGQLDHLGELRHIHLYGNDRQIEEIAFSWREFDEVSYLLTLRSLED